MLFAIQRNHPEPISCCAEAEPKANLLSVSAFKNYCSEKPATFGRYSRPQFPERYREFVSRLYIAAGIYREERSWTRQLEVPRAA